MAEALRPRFIIKLGSIKQHGVPSTVCCKRTMAQRLSAAITGLMFRPHVGGLGILVVTRNRDCARAVFTSTQVAAQLGISCPLIGPTSPFLNVSYFALNILLRHSSIKAAVQDYFPLSVRLMWPAYASYTTHKCRAPNGLISYYVNVEVISTPSERPISYAAIV